MNDNATIPTRRERRRAATKAHRAAVAKTTGRATVTALAVSGALMGTGVAANAAAGPTGGGEEVHYEQAQPAEQQSYQSSGSYQGAENSYEPQGGQQETQNSGVSAASTDTGQVSNNSVVSAAYNGIGTPYSWGGTTTAGFDCSGFINWAYQQAGHGNLPRTTYGMEASLTHVSNPQPGDIVLANGSSHGGIYVGNGQVISATTSEGVRVHGMHESWHTPNAILRPGA